MYMYVNSSMRPIAVLMIQQRQADGDGTDGEHDDAQDPILRPVQLPLHPWDALGGSDVDVNAGRNGQDDAHGVGGNVVDGQDDDATQHDRQTREEVESQGPLDRKAGMFGQDEEVGQLLSDLVIECNEEDGKGNVPGAKEEADANEDSIGKVVEGITNEDGGAQGVVDGITVAAVLLGGSGGSTSDVVGGQSLILEDALAELAILSLAAAIVILVIQGQAIGILAVLALLAVIGRSVAGSDGMVGKTRWDLNRVACFDQSQRTGLRLTTEARSLAALLVALVLVGTGEHGSQDHGEEVAAEDGTAELPVGTLGTLAGMLCCYEKDMVKIE